MSKRIVINADNGLDYFKSIVRSGLSGEFGAINEVRIVVTDDGKLNFGVNGYVSEDFGQAENPEETNAAAAQSVSDAQSDLKKAAKKARLSELERRVSDLEAVVIQARSRGYNI